MKSEKRKTDGWPPAMLGGGFMENLTLTLILFIIVAIKEVLKYIKK